MKGKSRDKDDSLVSVEGLKLSGEESDPVTQIRKRKRGGFCRENTVREFYPVNMRGSQHLLNLLRRPL